jgi:hypothetical protein
MSGVIFLVGGERKQTTDMSTKTGNKFTEHLGRNIRGRSI